MIVLNAKIRKDFGEKIKKLRKKGILPAILYGPKIKSLPLEIDLKSFEKIFKEVGETEFITLKIEGKKRNYHVLIKEIQRDPLTQDPIHVDFYQPQLKKKISTIVPLSFVGESFAVKELRGTLVKNFSEVEIRSFPKDIPKEIEVDISKLKTFEDKILVEDLKLPKGVEILRDKKDIVAFVSPPEKIEEVKKPEEKTKEETQKDEKTS
jgi:large subunit ribosomal protein L25